MVISVLVEVLEQAPPEVLGAADGEWNRTGGNDRDVHAGRIVTAPGVGGAAQ